MFVCGFNDCGQLGLGDEEDRNTFTVVPALPDGKVAKQVVAGGAHTMILAEDGTVFACGHNGCWQLGLGNTTSRNTFTAVPALPDGKVAKQVVAGRYHTMILAEDGTVFACGYNANGQLGLGDTAYRNTFTAVPALPDGKVAKQVVAGRYHTMILAEDGTVFACGYNFYGQLGLGDTTDRNTFTAVPALPDDKVAKQVVAGSNHSMILAEDGTVFASGWNHLTFTAVPAFPDGKVTKQIANGGNHTMILAEDGTVFV
jgi:alpha-tubulin suppressor-like RCC1 family protein